MRILTLGLALLVSAALPLLVAGEALAGGGNFPPQPPGTLQATDITATIVIDPNGPVPFNPGGASGPSNLGPGPDTPTGAVATIVLSRPGFQSASASFQVSGSTSLGDLRYGCNLGLTASRFVNLSNSQVGLPIGGPNTSTSDPFANWVPSNITVKLFSQLSITLTDGTTIFAVPGITGVISQSCAPFPKKNETLNDLAFALLLANVKPFPGLYPDRSTGSTDPSTTWFPGFLVLQATIGLWQ